MSLANPKSKIMNEQNITAYVWSLSHWTRLSQFLSAVYGCGLYSYWTCVVLADAVDYSKSLP